MPSKVSGSLRLDGVSGTQYRFTVFHWDTKFKTVGGVYYISKRKKYASGTVRHDEIFIGETADLTQIKQDERCATCFERLGANAIAVHPEADAGKRANIVADLIDAYQPPCNF